MNKLLRSSGNSQYTPMGKGMPTAVMSGIEMDE
jgi:hypothetical protein